MGEQQKSNQTEQDLNHVLKARRDKLAELQAAGKDPFQITKYDVTAHSMDIKEHYEEWEGKEVSIAGRLMFKRVMGKASFCNIQDLKGNKNLPTCISKKAPQKTFFFAAPLIPLDHMYSLLL